MQKRHDRDHKAYHNAPSVQLPKEEGDMHIIYWKHLVHYSMPCDPNALSSVFIQSLYLFTCVLYKA